MTGDVEEMLDWCVRGGAFFVPPPGKVRIGRAAGARRIFLDRPDVPNDRPIVDVAVIGDRIHVRRHVAMRGGEWIEELVGTAPPRRELIERCIEMALVGTSRLPITSLETPLPVYALGMIAYVPGGGGDETIVDPLTFAPRVGDPTLNVTRRARTLEIILRAATQAQIPSLARQLAAVDLAPVLREMFNLLVLSPYTCLVDNLVALFQQIGGDVAVDAIGYMLRRLARHLNAFDLVKFHNRGANYPDALMLDALLRTLIPMMDDRPATRCALLHGWLARRRCENVLVPTSPTSPGEAARLMPPHVAAIDPEHRTRRLFHDAPAEAMLTSAARDALRRAAAEDLTELGMATFLDRPLGLMKRPGEADRTPLLSYEGFSRRLAQRRVNELIDLGLLPSAPPMHNIRGYPVAKMLGHAREGVVALEDAKKAAFDFVFTRTTRSSLGAFVRQYDWSALTALTNVSPDQLALLIRTCRGVMTGFDAGHRPILRLNYADARYHEFAGEEYVDGLEAVIATSDAHEPPAPVQIPPIPSVAGRAATPR
jgi:hypothetical protein